MKFPSPNQWSYFFNSLSVREKIIFAILLISFFVSGTVLFSNFYTKNTKIVAAKGGEYTIFLQKPPQFINPIYSVISDTERDVAEILFSGLMKYTPTGDIVPDLIKEYNILNEGKNYEICLKEKIFWSDGKPITSDDVIFTIKTIQNPDYKSPLRGVWVGIETERISNSCFRLKLKEPYIGFIENLSLKIIPKHIWENISAEAFPISSIIFYPITSGPYKLGKINKTKQEKFISAELIPNPLYSKDKPYISKIIFSIEKEKKTKEKMAEYSFDTPRYFAIFFNLNHSLLKNKAIRQALSYGIDKKEILTKIFSQDMEIVESPILPNFYHFNPPDKIYEFNKAKAIELFEKEGFKPDENGNRFKKITKKSSFEFKNNLKVNSQGEEVKKLQECLKKENLFAENVNGNFGEKTKNAVIGFQEKYKDEILKPNNLKKGTGEVRELTIKKLNEICFPASEETVYLSFSIFTVNQEEMKKIAEGLKSFLNEIGVKIEIKTFYISTFEKDIIKPRNFDIILFGEVYGLSIDPLPFWHSLQKEDPGLNLSGYENEQADKLLEEARKTFDAAKRKELLEKFQNILIEDAPAIFLCKTNYKFIFPQKIKGISNGIIIDPSKRFSNIENWYIKTKRVWK